MARVKATKPRQSVAPRKVLATKKNRPEKKGRTPCSGGQKKPHRYRACALAEEGLAREGPVLQPYVRGWGT
eukprot:gene17016-23302_t